MNKMSVFCFSWNCFVGWSEPEKPGRAKIFQTCHSECDTSLPFQCLQGKVQDAQQFSFLFCSSVWQGSRYDFVKTSPLLPGMTKLKVVYTHEDNPGALPWETEITVCDSRWFTMQLSFMYLSARLGGGGGGGNDCKYSVHLAGGTLAVLYKEVYGSRSGLLNDVWTSSTGVMYTLAVACKPLSFLAQWA